MQGSTHSSWQLCSLSLQRLAAAAAALPHCLLSMAAPGAATCTPAAATACRCESGPPGQPAAPVSCHAVQVTYEHHSESGLDKSFAVWEHDACLWGKFWRSEQLHAADTNERLNPVCHSMGIVCLLSGLVVGLFCPVLVALSALLCCCLVTIEFWGVLQYCDG